MDKKDIFKTHTRKYTHMIHTYTARGQNFSNMGSGPLEIWMNMKDCKKNSEKGKREMTKHMQKIEGANDGEKERKTKVKAKKMESKKEIENERESERRREGEKERRRDRGERTEIKKERREKEKNVKIVEREEKDRESI